MAGRPEFATKAITEMNPKYSVRFGGRVARFYIISVAEEFAKAVAEVYGEGELRRCGYLVERYVRLFGEVRRIYTERLP